MDFPTTRSLIAALPGWVSQFAARLPQPGKVPLPTGGFRWRHAKTDHDTLQVTKAVRIASGLRAAMLLADARHTVECVALLRMVSDFSAEILFISQGVLSGQFTKEQATFIEQHHRSLPSTPDELAEREREYYVGRKAIAKAQRRLAEATGGGADLLERMSAFLNKGYDSYVHGSYDSAMELFTGQTMTFMLEGTESPRAECIAKVSVAGKLGEVLIALRSMAITRQMASLSAELKDGFDRLTASGGESSRSCAGL